MTTNYSSDNICIENIDNLLQYFELNYSRNRTRITMPCPVHGGDNPGACTIFLDSPPNWKCWTHHCENQGTSIFSFFKLLLQNKIKKEVTNGQFRTWLENKYGPAAKEGRPKLETYDMFKQTIEHTFGIERNRIKSYLGTPPQQMLDKGYSTEVLTKYDIFNCNNPKKKMYQRTVVPVYNASHTHVIGCTGRSIFEKCENCRLYHNPKSPCPSSPYEKVKCSKWINSNGFKKTNLLYNIWFASDHIKETGQIILVESPGNVWKLEQNGIHNSVAIFGSNISDGQLVLIESLPVREIVLLFDNDKAGETCKENSIKLFSRLYNIVCPEINYLGTDDISKLEDSYLNTQLKGIICKKSC